MTTGIEHSPQIVVKDPVSGETVGTVTNHSAEEIGAAVDRARAAQPGWDARGSRGRARLLQLWGDELWRSRETIIQTIRRETGKNDTGALLEIIVLDNVIDYYAHHTPRLLRPQRRRTMFPIIQNARVYYKPYGVVGFITPWNYPYLNAYLDVIPALAAGNTAVLKPSEITPFTAQYAAACAYRAGIPQDVIQVITGDGQTGAALVDRVDYIAVTGSTATGRKVAVRAAERLIPYSLELGGKDPLIVLEDVDLDMAAATVLQGALENAGQVCVSTERVYVVETIYDHFVERLAHYAHQLNVGPGDGLDVHVGSMTNEREVRRCETQVADAISKGAQVIFGGRRRPELGPLFFEPTILVDVNHTMDVMREETFGPLVPVMRVSNAEEAVRLANDSQYGLSSAILTRDLKRGQRLARQLQAGDTSINRTQFVIGTPSLPSGGVKDSGIGRRNGPEGLMRFVRTQSILTDRLWIAKPILTQLDPTLFRLLKIQRVLRRWIPFLRL
ncbi:MAG: aldehyde dehydrogenase family protein [Chloroflexi bacterium]|nr:aldehyde dehydrogenase family protein [Chloroflexota bacterium]